MPKALDGIRVLDFTRAFAGPLCTYLLRELGAEVIKVEIPGSGDSVRQVPPLTKGGESYVGVSLNRGKKSITLNLKSPEGQKLACDLARKCDVLVENYSADVMKNMGLDYDEIKKINPNIIYASSSGFGHTGPKRTDTAFDSVIQAAGGLMAVNGYPDRGPLRAGINIADFLSGIYTTIAILAGLHHRDKTGEGQSIDISMQDVLWTLVAFEHSPGYFLNGRLPERTGNRTLVMAPSNNYPTKDGGYVRVNASMLGQWQDLCRIMGREDLMGVDKYGSVKGRLENVDEVDALVEKWTKSHTTNEIIGLCRDGHVPCTTIPSFDEVANDPQLLSRDMIVEVDQLLSGTLKVPGTPFKMSKTPGDPIMSAPFLGENNFDILSTLLGYTEEEFQKLQDDGTV
jgi:CoA:oxalate CoA-transferase